VPRINEEGFRDREPHDRIRLFAGPVGDDELVDLGAY
jgi:hypothetical protein